uniref:Uncharacterized protein n=1 Tax=Rhizophora mucronata TaxID=61149 RepID=A0A2P2PBE2_RHIMU
MLMPWFDIHLLYNQSVKVQIAITRPISIFQRKGIKCDL